MNARRQWRLSGLLMALLVGLAAPLQAQWLSDSESAAHRISGTGDLRTVGLTAATVAQPPVAGLVLAGAGGAAIGTLGGAFLGYHLDRSGPNWGCAQGCEDPGLYGLVGGWFIGSALLTPIAVHLANERRGSLSSSYLASAAIAGAGMLSLAAVGGSPVGAVILLGAPVAQVVSAVTIERRSAP